VVEEELEQRQVIGSQMAAEKEVTAQPAVEVPDHRTGANGAVGHVLHAFA
jgi:hypothetical protein